MFHEPYASWYPELPRARVRRRAVDRRARRRGDDGRAVHAGGDGHRVGVVTYDLFLSTTHLHNNRAYLLIVLAALAVTPCGRELSVDAWWRRRRGLPPLPTMSPAWPLWLLRFEAATVYGASGLSKLLDRDWFGGEVTWHRVVPSATRIEASVLPDWAIDVLADRSFHTVAAKLIIATELFIALGLWSAAPAMRRCGSPSASMSPSSSPPASRCSRTWRSPRSSSGRCRRRATACSWSTRSSAAQRRLARTVGALDWLARFRIEDGAPGSPLRVVDRDGRVLDGGRAVRFALSRLPVTAWFALPTLVRSAAARPTSGHARARPR